jgi:hypothetical protein
MINDDNGPIVNDEMDEISRAAAKEAAKAANKPMIDHLPDAVETDEMGLPTLLAEPGDKIIIERVATVLSHKPWLDTKTYTIESIDAATGNLALWDDDLHRSATSNFVQGIKVGYRFKLPTSKGLCIGHKKRGRPKKNPTGIPEEPKPVLLGPDGKPVAKRRGRPPGTKNRSREVIMAEKRAKLEKKKR